MNSQPENILVQSDPILGKIILQITKPIIISSEDVFHDLMSCILEQQIHYRSSKKIFAKALERAGISKLSLDNFNLLEKHSLPHLKLSQAKAETMILFVEYWKSNTRNFLKLTNEEVITELSSIKGIGKWTIDMILLYTLQRPDVFPYDDFHLKEIMQKLYGLNPISKLKAQMFGIAEHWGNQKSLAVLYLLESKRLKIF